MESEIAYLSRHSHIEIYQSHWGSIRPHHTDCLSQMGLNCVGQATHPKYWPGYGWTLIYPLSVRAVAELLPM